MSIGAIDNRYVYIMLYMKKLHKCGFCCFLVSILLVCEALPVRAQSSGMHNGHEYVDLGLSVMWAIVNIGAETPRDLEWESGRYMWGMTRLRPLSDENCITLGVDMGGDISGIVEFDAARANWGGRWRVPTKKEWKELIEKCQWVYVHDAARPYVVITGPSRGSIILSLAKANLGDAHRPPTYGAQYWSSSPYEYSDICAYGLALGSSDHDCDRVYEFDKWLFYGNSRSDGYYIRPCFDRQ